MSETPTRRRGIPGGAASVADKRFRRPDVRPAKRRRFSQRLWRLLCLGVILAVLVTGGVLASSRVVDARLMAVDRVVVQGNQRVSVQEIFALVGDVRGQSLLLVDLEQVRARLLDSPWVASVAVRRVLPSTIDVRLVEREPVAIARLGQQLYLVDGTGVIIDEYGPQHADFDLPIADGMAVTLESGGSGIDPARAQLVARFLSALAARPELRRSISQIDVSVGGNVAVLLNDDPTLLHLGDEQFVDRLRTYLEIRPTLMERMDDIESVDLRYGANVIARNRKDRTQRQ